MINITKICSLRKLVFILIINLNLGTLLIAQTGNVPVQSPPALPGPFAIDGFLQRQGAASGDWLSGPGGSGNFIFTDAGVALVPLCYRLIDKYNSASDEVFSLGSVQQDPNTMRWALKKAISKTDMNNILVFLAANPIDNQLWLILGADRRSTGKNSSIDFEFMQNQVVMTGAANTNHTKGFYSAGPHGGRTVGDAIISVNFANLDGASASTEFYRWQSTGPGSYAYVPFSPATGTAFAATNNVPIQVPFGAFGSTTYPALTFVETAISVSTLGLSSTVWIKSQSNDTFDDFYPPIFASAGVQIAFTYSFSDALTAQLNADISPLNANDYNFHWTAIGAMNESGLNTAVTGSLNDPDISNPVFTADANFNCMSYIYRVSVANKNNPGTIVGETNVVINDPCGTITTLNQQQTRILSEVSASIDQQLKVFPNPVKGSLTVSLTKENSARDIHLINISGVVVQRWPGVTTNTLQLKSLPPGLYLLKVLTKATGKTETIKIVLDN